MELTQAIYGRRAVRSYAAAPVSDSQIKVLIEAAIQAPSAMNLQPWLATTGPAMLIPVRAPQCRMP